MIPSGRRQTISAQRLTASMRGSPGCATPSARSRTRCSTPNGINARITTGASYDLANALCAQRLTASMRGSHGVLQLGGYLLQVLNA